MKSLQSISPVVLVALFGTAWLVADDAPSSDPEPALTQAKPEAEGDDAKPGADETDAAAGNENLLADWDQLKARKLEIAEELRDLKARFPLAGPVERADIRKKFGEKVREYELDVAAKMENLAKDVLAKRPDDPEAAAIRMHVEFDANHYAEALTLAETVIDAGDAVPYEFTHAKRVAAASCFALHDFQRAAELLAGVEHAPGWTRSPSLEKPQLEPAAKDYIGFWETEQAIRAKEVGLEGDQALPRVQFEIVDADGKAKGTVEMLLFADEAPNTVASFVKTVKSGEYDGRPFHRVIPNFMAQGGMLDPEAPWTIASEYGRENARKHFRGSLSMANTGPPNTGGSQFFLTVLPTFWLNAQLDDEGQPARGHTVFGRVVTGMDVVDDIIASDKIKKATMTKERPNLPEPVRENESEPEPEPTTPDPKPEDAKPTDEKPETSKPDTPKPGDGEPDGPNPFEPKPDDAKPDTPKPDEPNPFEPKPDAPKPSEPEGDEPSPSE